MSHIDESKDSTAEQTIGPKLTFDVIGTRIRQIREARGQSIEEIAKGAGLTPAALEAVETGKTDPILTQVLKIVASLEVPMAQLFSDLSPGGVVVAASFDDVPEDLKDAVKTILSHPSVKA